MPGNGFQQFELDIILCRPHVLDLARTSRREHMICTARHPRRSSLVHLDHQLPGGNLIAAEMRLAKAIPADALFAEHNLPTRDLLLTELAIWHTHLKDNIDLMTRTSNVLSNTIKSVAERRG